jgi:hypothetical protein
MQIFVLDFEVCGNKIGFSFWKPYSTNLVGIDTKQYGFPSEKEKTLAPHNGLYMEEE